jgi:hypothetical protein
VRRLAAECPLDRYLPTGVAQSWLLGARRRAATKKCEIFSAGRAPDITLRTSFWQQFLHWNNSKQEETYCIKGF